MKRKRLPVKIIAVILAVWALFIFGTKNKTTTDDLHSSWKEYCGGPDHRLIADGSTAIIYIFMH